MTFEVEPLKLAAPLPSRIMASMDAAVTDVPVPFLLFPELSRYGLAASPRRQYPESRLELLSLIVSA